MAGNDQADFGEMKVLWLIGNVLFCIGWVVGRVKFRLGMIVRIPKKYRRFE